MYEFEIERIDRIPRTPDTGLPWSYWICFEFRIRFITRNLHLDRSNWGELTMPSGTEAADRAGLPNALTCELEDWFHILDSDKTPKFEDWGKLPLCAERNVERLLHLFERDARSGDVLLPGVDGGTHAAGGAEMPGGGPRDRLARVRAHHGPSHEPGHLPGGHRAGQGNPGGHHRAAKSSATGRPGFSVKNGNTWFFDVVSESGYRYDASVFPAHHGHGGYSGIDPGPHVIATSGGPLVEIPVSTVSILGRRLCFFGGGYLRLSPLPVIRWGARHSREREQAADRLRAPPGDRSRITRVCLWGCGGVSSATTTWRRRSPSCKWLCEHNRFGTMAELASRIGRGVAGRV